MQNSAKVAADSHPVLLVRGGGEKTVYYFKLWMRDAQIDCKPDVVPCRHRGDRGNINARSDVRLGASPSLRMVASNPPHISQTAASPRIVRCSHAEWSLLNFKSEPTISCAHDVPVRDKQ